MARLSRQEMVDGLKDGSVTQMTRTDAAKLLKDLGFRDVSLQEERGRKSHQRANKIMYAHPELDQERFTLPRDNLVPPDTLNNLRKIVADLFEKNPNVLARFDTQPTEQWSEEVNTAAGRATTSLRE